MEIEIVTSVVSGLYGAGAKFAEHQKYSKIDQRIKCLEKLNDHYVNSDELEFRLLVEKYLKDINRLDDELLEVLVKMCNYDESNHTKYILELLLSVPSRTLNNVYRDIERHLYCDIRSGKTYILPYNYEVNSDYELKYFVDDFEISNLLSIGFMKPHETGARFGYPVAMSYEITKVGLYCLKCMGKVPCFNFSNNNIVRQYIQTNDNHIFINENQYLKIRQLQEEVTKFDNIFTGERSVSKSLMVRNFMKNESNYNIDKLTELWDLIKEPAFIISTSKLEAINSEENVKGRLDKLVEASLNMEIKISYFEEFNFRTRNDIVEEIITRCS